jgi:hypothetical protein
MIQPAFTDPERLALAAYLAGYRGLTREAYTLDLRQFTTWCRARSVNLFAVRRADIESFARDPEAKGRARATVTRRLCTIAAWPSTGTAPAGSPGSRLSMPAPGPPAADAAAEGSAAPDVCRVFTGTLRYTSLAVTVIAPARLPGSPDDEPRSCSPGCR